MKKIIVAACVVLVLSVGSSAQTRKRQTTKHPASKTTGASSTEAAAAARTDGANRVATQIKNLSRFLYLVGGVVKGIEAVDAQAKDGQASPTNERNKAQLRS